MPDYVNPDGVGAPFHLYSQVSVAKENGSDDHSRDHGGSFPCTQSCRAARAKRFVA